jgi:protein phosphatase
MKTLSELAEEATHADSKSFSGLITRVSQLLLKETEDQRKLSVTGRLVHHPPSGEAIIVGDIHGDLESLKHILHEERLLEEKMKGNETYLVFLGDYGDRGPASPEVFHIVLSLKETFLDRVILLQGNHEGPEDLLAHPHDLPYQLQRKFGSDWRTIYAELSTLFRSFYTAVLVENRCIMLHGGVPSAAKTIEDLAYAYEKHPAEPHLEEILWSDPVEGILGTRFSPRGAGRLFGKDVTDRFLRILGVKYVIRGHEPAKEGFKVNHEGRILTLFSRKGPPYYNVRGAYLKLDLARQFDSVWQLTPHVRQF